jgi:hypothetical protein
MHVSPSSTWPGMTPAKREKLKAEALCILSLGETA